MKSGRLKMAFRPRSIPEGYEGEGREALTDPDRLMRIEAKVDTILKYSIHRKFRTIRDIADEFEMHPKTVKKRPWMMPNWGRSDFPGREKRWLIPTYDDWFKIPPAKRKRMWEDMPHRDKQRATA